MNKILPKTFSRYLAVRRTYNILIGFKKDEIIEDYSSSNHPIFIDFENKIKKKKF